MVITRSSAGMKADRALSTVVLPLEVLPVTSMLHRARTARRRKSAASGESVPVATRVCQPSMRGLNLRMAMAQPSRAGGESVAQTRLPSARRASRMGCRSSMRRRIGWAMRSARWRTAWSLSKASPSTRSSRPCRSTQMSS